MTDTLRAALSADEDTPTGIDVTAVRTRAARLRRTRYAVAATAAVTALAVLIPVAVLQRDRAATTAATPPALTCPDRVPVAPVYGGGSGDLLPPGPVTGALICTYADSRVRPSSGGLSGSARLTAAEATALAARLAAAPPRVEQACTQELSSTFALRIAGPGRTTTLRVETYGCVLVSNGTVTRVAGADKSYLRQLEARATR